MAIDLSSFRPYYYHAITNEVTWDNPVPVDTGKESAPGTWAKAADELTGRFYYYHTITGQVTWANPFAFAQTSRNSTAAAPPADATAPAFAQPPLQESVSEAVGARAAQRHAARATAVEKDHPDEEALAIHLETAAGSKRKFGSGSESLAMTSESLHVDSRGKKFMTAKGCCQNKTTGNWRADIRVMGRSQYIGTFPSSEEASRAFATVEKALDESGFSRMDDEALEVFKKARGQVRRKNSMDAKGFYQAKSGNWKAEIYVKGQTRYIGTFPSSEEASNARALVEKALDESGLSKHDDEALEVFNKAREQARASLSVKKKAYVPRDEKNLWVV